MSELSNQEVERLVVERNTFRQAEEYEFADDIRFVLEDHGIAIEDTKHGTTWYRKSRQIGAPALRQPIPSGKPIVTPYTPDWMRGQ